jgi:hypothetical protein
MNLSIRTEGVAEVKQAMAALGRNAPKAVTLWVNWVGLTAQGEMRERLPSSFSMRGTQEQFRKAVVFQSASTTGKREKQAMLVIGSDGPGGTKASATKNFGRILARHEEGETRNERNQVYRLGSGGVITSGFFLPAKGLRTSTTNVPRSMYPTSVGAQIRSDPSGQVYFAKGTKKGSKKQGTGVSYFATEKGIFRRRHSSFGGRVDVEAIWWFRYTVRTPARTKLWETAQRVWDTKAVALGQQAIEESLFRMSL